MKHCEAVPMPSHAIHVWYVCLHERLMFIVNDGKCREIYHARMLWDVVACAESRVPDESQEYHPLYTLPETNIAPEKRSSQRKLIFQPSIFRCELLVYWRVTIMIKLFLA